MAQLRDPEESTAPESAVDTSSSTVDGTLPAGPPNQHSVTGANEFKTIAILKEWPIVKSSVGKAKQCYESLKTSSGVFNPCYDLVERSVRALGERSSNVLPVLYPAMRIADLAASSLAEELQKKLPVVRQPPSQVYHAVRNGFSDVLSPFVDKIEFIPGIVRIRNVAKSVLEVNQKLILHLAKWLGPYKSEGIKDPQVWLQQPQPAVTGATQVGAASLPTSVADAARFFVGSSVGLLSRLCDVGAFISQTATPASSKSTSPER